MKSRSKSGFTLVEILIVVVILGILAAIVIPQFSQASSDARVSSVKSNLQMLRSQVELYKIQHADAEPDANSIAAFTDCLTKKSDIDGSVNVSSGAYGPYMQKFPENAVNQKGSGVTAGVIDGSGILAQAVDPGLTDTNADNGWIFNNVDGTFFAVDATAEQCNW
jgi:general secretion pathway protein G